MLQCASFSQTFKIPSHIINIWKQRCAVNSELIEIIQYLFLILNPDLNLVYQTKLYLFLKAVLIQTAYYKCTVLFKNPMVRLIRLNIKGFKQIYRSYAPLKRRQLPRYFMIELFNYLILISLII